MTPLRQAWRGIVIPIIRPGLVGAWVLIMIIFLVALVIINNALVMATLERVPEFGTLRAVGAQRRFILTASVSEPDPSASPSPEASPSPGAAWSRA